MPKKNMITTQITLEKKSVDEAPNYAAMASPPEMLLFKRVLVIKGGMHSGAPSFDIQMEDENGKQFLAVVSGNILRMIADYARHEFPSPGNG